MKSWKVLQDVFQLLTGSVDQRLSELLLVAGMREVKQAVSNQVELQQTGTPG